MFFELNKDKSKCWWCGSDDLSGEHKLKKTDLEMLYGKVYSKDNMIRHVKYRTESKGKNIQSSDSDRVKFEKNLCKYCNGTKSQVFDEAYQQFIKYYYCNRMQIKESHMIDLVKVFGKSWKHDYLNVKRYIGKHVGCRMAEIGILPSNNLIAFLNNDEGNNDLKVLFQLKPYFMGNIEDAIDTIFLGPGNPINYSVLKFKDLVTSFCGWYSIANLTWNYLHEIGISKGTEISRYIELQVVDYKQMDGIIFKLSEDTMIEDYSEILDKLEYYPFKGKDRDIEHYQFLKNEVIQH